MTPDNTGSYVNGTWSQIASLPVINGTQYGPQYFSSAVLPDGRVIIEGGEYNVSCTNNLGTWTSLGAIYDPAANTWTAVSPPSGSGWTNTDAPCSESATGGIGDAQSIVLPNGTFLLGACCGSPDVDALFNARNLSWSSTGAPQGGSFQDEQGYTLLPNGNVLTIDVWTPPNAEQYTPSTGVWTNIAQTPVSLIDPATCGNFEIGPAMTRPDGTTVAFGGNSGCTGQADPTAIYTASSNSWVQGPNLPATCGTGGATNCSLVDAPAAMLPNGNILFAASAGAFQTPTHFFEFTSANSVQQVSDTVYFASSSSSYYYNFLVLPSGQILTTDFSNTPEVYNPTGSPNSAWLPVISSVSTSLNAGGTYTLSGTQLNGLSQGASYGDDVQGATNYPLVRVTNNSTGHVFYYKTFNFSTMSIAPNTASSFSFTVPASAEAGASTLAVVANGIASQPVAITISPSVVHDLSVSVTGNGSVTSSPTGINCGATCSANFAAGTQVTLTASPANGVSFSGWGGACSGTGTTCTVTMSSDVSVTATFGANLATLSVSIDGSGTVTSTDGSINCGSTCSATYPTGTQVTLNAAPASGYSFFGWGGACTGTGSCTVTMTASMSISANFGSINQSGKPNRTFVSGQGTDTGTCPLTAPCRSFAYAVAETNIGGELAVLNTAGYGPVTIVQAISIINQDGVEAGVTTTSADDGITISAGSGDVVNLRGLTLSGGGVGNNGITVNSAGAVNIQNCVVRGFTANGLNIVPGGSAAFNLSVSDSILSNNGANENGSGAYVAPIGSGAIHAVFERVQAIGNGIAGFYLSANSATGGTLRASAVDSVASNNDRGFQVFASFGFPAAIFALNGSKAVENGYGLYSNGDNAIMAVAQSVISGNSTAGYSTASNGIIWSTGNNLVTDTNNSGTLSSIAPQ